MSKSFNRLSKALAKILGISTEELINSFSPAQKSDLEDLVAFRSQFFPNGLKWDDRDYLRWRYDFSDDCEKYHGQIWLLRVRGDILGTIGMENFELIMSGEKLDAYHPLDLMTKSSLKGIGIGAWLNLALMEKFPIIFVLGSSEEAESLVRKIYHPLPDCISWKLPISILGSLKRKIKIPILVNLLAAVWDSYSSLARFIRFRNLVPGKTIVKSLDRFEEDVDQISIKFPPAEIFRHRSCEYLNWRFIDNPCTKYHVLGLYDVDSDKLVAYSVIHFVDSTANKQLEAVIDDLFWGADVSETDRCSLAKAMLANTVNSAVESGAKLIEFAISTEDSAKILDSLGFFPRGSGSVCGIYAEDSNISDKLYNAKLWYITEGDAHGEYY